MQQPTQDERDAMQRIAARPEGQALTEYLKRNMTIVDKALHNSNDLNDVRKLQGMAVTLDVLIAGFK